MQRFHRLGSVGLGLIIAAFTFHLVAVSYDRWTINTCTPCLYTYFFREFRTSIRQRCYRISMDSYLNETNTTEGILNDPFTAYVCVPNQYLFAKDVSNDAQCLGTGKIGPHNACTSKQYNQGLCQCDFTKSTKAMIALAVISSILLGIMVIVSHFASYVQHDFILNWLVPGGFFTLMVAFVAIFGMILITGGNKAEDIDEVVRWRQLEAVNNSTISLANDTNWLAEANGDNFKVTFGLSFGMEIIAANLTLVSAIIYALMFIAKKRPNT